MTQQRQADLIKFFAVVTAAPRWVGALLAAEGFEMPVGWLAWWLPLSALLSAGMAVVEGVAFAYVFNAWRTQRDKAADRLILLAILSAGVFVAVLSPFIAAQVRQVSLATVLGTGWLLWTWSASVAASTIVIVASVGYAQKQRDSTGTSATTARKDAPVIADDDATASITQATIKDWRAIYRASNGDYRQVKADGVKEAVEAAGYVPPSDSTLRNWAREARDHH